MIPEKVRAILDAHGLAAKEFAREAPRRRRSPPGSSA